MTNNDILRRLRYTFEFNDSKMISIFAAADHTVDREQISNWLKREDDETYQEISDPEMAQFLNGFINDRRGKKEGAQPQPEARLSNNIIFRKLTIALNLKSEDVLKIMALTEMSLGKHELSAFFRKRDHKNYRECQDQVFRNFLNGMQQKYRSEQPSS